MPADPASFLVTGFANLHKTHVEKPAYNLCDPEASDAKGFDLACSLVCYLGEAFISGAVTYSLYSEACDGVPVDTFLYAPSEFTFPIGCSPNYDDTVMLNNTWVGTGSVSTSHGITDHGYKIKLDATMIAVAPGQLVLTVVTSRLMPGTLLWSECNTQAMALSETPESAASDGYFARYFESALTATTFSGVDCSDEVKYVKSRIILMSYRFGCATGNPQSAPKCALRSLRGGIHRLYSCLVCLITPAARYAWTPQVVQMGNNPIDCGDAAGTGCGCYEWDGVIITPNHQTKEDVLNIGCPDEAPDTNIQQIQYAFGGNNSFGTYQIILKSINRTGAMCIAARIFGQPTWILGTLTVLQEVDPFIMQANYTGLLDGDPVFQFYGMEFPTAAVRECVASVNESAPPPLEPHDSTTQMMIPAFSLAREMATRMQSVRTRPCVSLGMALEDSPSCGCGGGILHQCGVHGECRQAGNDPEKKLCWKCDDYHPGELAKTGA